MLIDDSARPTITPTASPTTTTAPRRAATHRSRQQRRSTQGPLRVVAVLAAVLAAVALLTILVAILAAFQLGAFTQLAASATGSAPPSQSGSIPQAIASNTPATSPTVDDTRASADAQATSDLPPIHPLADLSPDLARYVESQVESQAGAMGVAIYDVTRGRAYGDDDDTTFTLASSAKVYILCGYLDMLERQGRAPTSTERGQMARMIEYSDNNAAQWLYNHLGGARGQQAYLERSGIEDYVPHGNSWGWARLSPDDMVRILALLRSGKLLTPSDTSYALGLLGHIERGTWGVGNTAPKGARVYMKDGWVIGPDGKWAQNSSGIVVDGDETYIISISTAHNPRYDWSKVQHVCAAVAGLLGDD